MSAVPMIVLCVATAVCLVAVDLLVHLERQIERRRELRHPPEDDVCREDPEKGDAS